MAHSHNLKGSPRHLGLERQTSAAYRTSALFSESTGRVLVSVGREDDVKFVGLCEARGIPVLRIGVTDNSGELEIQDIATWPLNDIRASHQGTLAELFG